VTHNLFLILANKMQIADSSNNSTLHNRARLYARIPASLDLRSVASCQSEHDNWKQQSSMEHFSKPLSIKTANIENPSVRMGSDNLPLDPRSWNRLDVKRWIVMLGRSEGIHDGMEEIAEQCFKMNGKALCLFSVEMFMSRFPLGGKMLFRDFRLRLSRAVNCL
jgi:hypothetical protein